MVQLPREVKMNCVLELALNKAEGGREAAENPPPDTPVTAKDCAVPVIEAESTVPERLAVTVVPATSTAPDDGEVTASCAMGGATTRVGSVVQVVVIGVGMPCETESWNVEALMVDAEEVIM